MGIDAPETAKGKKTPGQPFSQRTKKHLAKMVLNKVVDVKGYVKWGRPSQIIDDTNRIFIIGGYVDP